MFCVLEGNLFAPRLTHGLERSLSASIFDHVIDSVAIILFSDNSYVIYTDGLERRLSVSIFDHVIDSVGIILFSDDSYAIYTDGLERIQLVSVLLSPTSCIFDWGLERSLSACAHSHGLKRIGWMVFKECRCNSLVPQ